MAVPAPVEAWPRLDLGLLDEQTGAPPPFPLDVLPPLWRACTEAAAARTAAPVDYVALSLLAAAASLISDRRVAPARGWVEPCILWTMLVGPPSCGKTPAVEAVCGLLRTLEHQRQYGPQALQAGAMSAPLFTNGTTIDAVLGVLREIGPRGVLLVRDEHGGWPSQMARGTRDGSAQAFWLSTWCQRGLDLGWRGKTIELDGPSLSILGTAHPDALAPALTRDDSGMLARFLFVRPAPAACPRPLPLPEDEGAVTIEAVSALRRLCERPWCMRDLPLTDEAHAAFEDFRRAHRVPMRDLAGREAAWWGKGPSQVLRLAGVLTFLGWAAGPQGAAEPAHVPAGVIAAAARLWRDYLWPHAQATFRIAGAGGEGESRQRQVLRWLAARRLSEVSRENIRREALSQALDAAGTQRLIEDLVEGGWLQPVTPAKGGRGRRRRRWLVHPGLWGAETAGDLGPADPDDAALSISAISARASHAIGAAAPRPAGKSDPAGEGMPPDMDPATQTADAGGGSHGPRPLFGERGQRRREPFAQSRNSVDAAVQPSAA
ncbi:DUF3987 domain-containing protein [Vineibacter terrae]|uniref:DUF3987 domain-containing protein n=1 Tax=Vineibacter terrae TaxID=2586908 RepID=UPI002E37E8D5|nr:DUF3987 domain-containing protein [Vineibacter terrae]HEX2887315.1 DUF3987 domain-containing protein [Vineibacter terrae]